MPDGCCIVSFQLTSAFVNSSGKLITNGWNQMMHVADMKNPKKTSSTARKFVHEKKHCEKFVSIQEIHFYIHAS